MPTTTNSQRWKVIPHPLLGEKHPFHRRRFIVSADAVVEIYDLNPDVRNPRDWDTAWGLRNGVIICELNDSLEQDKRARLIAAAPDLLDIARQWMNWATGPVVPIAVRMQLQADTVAAIAKAEGET